MMVEKIHSVKELDKAAENLLASFPDCRIFAFFGKMGAGKTTFIQAVCRMLGSADYVTSPTFALINEYYGENSVPIYHFDFYRVKHIEEVFDIGYEEYLYSGNYCLIEWPEIIEVILPENFVEVKIDVEDSGARIISAEKMGN